MSESKTKPPKGGGEESTARRLFQWLVVYPLWIITWPLVQAAKLFHEYFLSYIISSVTRDQYRVYSVKFVWYGDIIYLHPMIWGSLILYGLHQTNLLGSGWVLFIWFISLFVCFMSIIYNFDIFKALVMVVGVVAALGVGYFATIEFAWNPLTAVADHIRGLNAAVEPGFYIISAYVFTLLIAAEVIWAWFFHRVEIDESYVYEHQFLRRTSRDPIFARGLRRETKDLLELLLLGSADIVHRTRTGYKRFTNVPFASLWVGRSLDSLLDYRRPGEMDLMRQAAEETDQAEVRHAFPDVPEGDDGDQAVEEAP